MKPTPDKWICDVCGEEIKSVNDGYLIWAKSDEHYDYDFLIIHQSKCDTHQDKYVNSLPLSMLVGQDGLSYLLSFVSDGPYHLGEDQVSKKKVVSIDEFVDLVRRLHLPYYEQARHKFGIPEVMNFYSDSSPSNLYRVSTLKDIADEKHRL